MVKSGMHHGTGFKVIELGASALAPVAVPLPTARSTPPSVPHANKRDPRTSHEQATDNHLSAAQALSTAQYPTSGMPAAHDLLTGTNHLVNLSTLLAPAARRSADRRDGCVRRLVALGDTVSAPLAPVCAQFTSRGAKKDGACGGRWVGSSHKRHDPKEDNEKGGAEGDHRCGRV